MRPTEEQASKIWDVLVEHCGAYDDNGLDRSRFIWCVAHGDDHCSEYRFCGILGFGGKFWVNQGRWYVSCYREDETERRSAVISETNRLIEKIRSMEIADGQNP